jgi:hypothetical protein
MYTIIRNMNMHRKKNEELFVTVRKRHVDDKEEEESTHTHKQKVLLIGISYLTHTHKNDV